MKTMTIKISKWFYFTLLSLIPILLLVFLLITIFFLGNGEKEFRDYFFLLFGLGICVMTIRGVMQYLNNAHKVIEIDEEKIRFGKEIFYWTELDYMVLTGKQSLKFIIDTPTEASTFYFKNGQIRYIFDGVYSNTQNIKIFLEQVVHKKTISKIYFPNIDIENCENISFDTFKNNPLTSFYGILLLVALASLLLVYIPQYLSISFFLIFFLICVFIFISASTMHYFQVSKAYFVVKHHCFFWKTKVYQMNNIKEIVFETPSSRSPNFVKIIQNNYQNELYSAGTLDDKTLLALKKRLEFYKIKVRDDLIYKL